MSAPAFVINWGIVAALIAPLCLLNVVAIFLFHHHHTRPVALYARALIVKWSSAEATKVCRALEKAVGRSAYLRNYAVEINGLCEAIMGMLSFGDLAAQERAASLVAHLAHEHPQIMGRFGRAGVVEACTRVASGGVHPTVISAACRALEALLGPPSTVAAAINRQRAKAAGAQQVLQALRDDVSLPQEGRRAAGAALVNLAPALSAGSGVCGGGHSRVWLSGMVSRLRRSRNSSVAAPARATIAAWSLEEGHGAWHGGSASAAAITHRI